MRIAVASDHAGFIQKAPIIEHIRSLGHEVIDLGPATDDRVDYPDFGDKVGRMVARGDADRGVVICGTGLDPKHDHAKLHSLEETGGRNGVCKISTFRKLLFGQGKVFFCLGLGDYSFG